MERANIANFPYDVPPTPFFHYFWTNFEELYDKAFQGIHTRPMYRILQASADRQDKAVGIRYGVRSGGGRDTSRSYIVLKMECQQTGRVDRGDLYYR